MSDPFPPRRRPSWGAATSEIFFPRPAGYPEDFSPYWPHGLDFSKQADWAAADRAPSPPAELDRLSVRPPAAPMQQAAPARPGNVRPPAGSSAWDPMNREAPDLPMDARLRLQPLDDGRQTPDDAQARPQLYDAEVPAFQRDLQSDSSDTHPADPFLMRAGLRRDDKGARGLDEDQARAGSALSQPADAPPPAAYRPALSNEQKDMAQSLQGVIANTGRVSPNTYYTMKKSGLRFGDVLGPGIYQAEFIPEVPPGPPPAIPMFWQFHAQYIYVDRNGNSYLLSSGPDERNGLSMKRGSFDGPGSHSLDAVVGVRAEAMRISNVALPQGMTPEQAWKLINADAEKLNSAGLIYDALDQNSNSFFYTIARHLGLGVNHDRSTPGSRRDLFLDPLHTTPENAYFHGILVKPPVF